jgi:hypothetical protein
MILRQLHGLLLGIGVHQASFVVVAVVVIIVVIIVDLHKLEQVLWLLGFLLLGLLLRMLDRVRRVAEPIRLNYSGSSALVITTQVILTQRTSDGITLGSVGSSPDSTTVLQDRA